MPFKHHAHRLVALFLIALAVAFHHGTLHAAEAGFDYKVISPTQAKESRAKVEILEFFSYRCPHCAQLEPSLKAWTAKLPKGVEVRRVPVVFSDTWETTARAYYALEAMGLVNKLHDKVFDAMHKQGYNFDDPGVFFDWAAKQGVDAKKLQDVYRSFGVSSKIARSKMLAKGYKLEGVPALAVNGKYITSASMTGTYSGLFATLDELVAMELGRKSAARK